MGFPAGSVVKNPPAVQEMQRCGFNPWIGRIPWTRKWQPILVILLENPMDRRTLQSAGATAAKLLQSCPTLCHPIDSSPPGFYVPGILQARILERVAISFSNACMCAKLLLSCLTLCDPMDSSAPGSSVHRILQARILEWVVISFFDSLQSMESQKSCT